MMLFKPKLFSQSFIAAPFSENKAQPSLVQGSGGHSLCLARPHGAFGGAQMAGDGTHGDN